MLNILLCDDDPFFLSLERECIDRIIQKDALPVLVAAVVSTPSEAAVFLEKNPGRYLIFLDFDFGRGRMSGLDISAVLKGRCENVRIVYTTNHQERAMDILKSGTEPFGFLEKGMELKTLASGLRRYIRMALQNTEGEPGKKGKTVLLNLGMGETVEIFLSDILYIEAEKQISHGITYHTLGGSHLTVLGTLEKEGKRLGDGFLRVHRSYLAAKNQIVALRNGYLALSDGQEIPCSLKMRGEVKQWITGT